MRQCRLKQQLTKIIHYANSLLPLLASHNALGLLTPQGALELFPQLQRRERDAVKKMATYVYGWVFLCCISAAEGLRYGSQSDSIHVSADLRDTELKNSPQIVAYEEWNDYARSAGSADNRGSPGLDAEEARLHRFRRQASSPPAAGAVLKSVVIHLTEVL